jgi:hypothetical protein
MMADDSTDEDSSAMVDAVFATVSNDRRRYALYFLTGRDATDVETLATVVAAWTAARADPTAVVTPDDREAVRTSLHHSHLPRLEREGFVRYDRETGTVELAEIPDLLETVLTRSLDQRRHAAGPESPGNADQYDSKTDDAP